MKSFEKFMEEQSFKPGQKVTVNNAKSYDSLSSQDKVEGTIIGHLSGDVWMVSVGSGQMNVKDSDLQ